MHLAEKARRHQQRRVLVLDQVGHHLHDGVFDVVGQLERLRPTRSRRRDPTARRGLRVEVRRCRRPRWRAWRRAQSRSPGRPPRRARRARPGPMPARRDPQRRARPRPSAATCRARRRARRRASGWRGRRRRDPGEAGRLRRQLAARWPCARHQPSRCTPKSGARPRTASRPPGATPRSARLISRWAPRSRPTSSRSILGRQRWHPGRRRSAQRPRRARAARSRWCGPASTPCSPSRSSSGRTCGIVVATSRAAAR